MSYFIRQFAEKSGNAQCIAGMEAGTITCTSTIEGTDQDSEAVSLLFSIMGTATGTKTIEGQDQDYNLSWMPSDSVARMGTCTCTESIEGDDQDKNAEFFFN